MFEDYANGILSPETRGECAKIVREAQEGTGNAEENNYVLEELNKYDAPVMQQQLALAREIVQGGYQGILEFDPARLRQSKEKEEKIVLREMAEAQKSMRRFFPDGNPEEPDIQTLDALYETQPKSRREAKEQRLQIQALEQRRLLYYRSTKPYTKAQKLLTDMENTTRLEEILAVEGEPAHG